MPNKLEWFFNRSGSFWIQQSILASVMFMVAHQKAYILKQKAAWKQFIGTQKLLCGNVTKFLIAKNGCAHRVQRTGISLGLIFHVSGSLIFQDFWDWKLKSRVLCTARYVHSVSANLKILFLFESSSQNLHLVVFSASPDIRIDRKWRHLEFFDFRIIRLIHRIWDDRNSMIMTSLIKIRYKIQKFISQKIFCRNFMQIERVILE